MNSSFTLARTMWNKPIRLTVNNVSLSHLTKAPTSTTTNCSRLYHQTKNNKSILLNNKPNSIYAMMTVNSLKNECRKRGIKVTGRKMELVNRLITNDNKINQNNDTQQIHTLNKNKKIISQSIKKELDAVKKNKILERSFSSNSTKSFQTTQIIRAAVKAPKSIENDTTNHVDHIILPHLQDQTPVETPIKILKIDSSIKETPQIEDPIIPEDTVVVVNDSQTVVSSKTITKGPDFTTSTEESPSTSSLPNFASSSSSSSSSSPLNISITSTPFYKQINKLVEDFSKSMITPDNTKYQIVEVKLSDYDVKFFTVFVGLSISYWIFTGIFEKDEKKVEGTK